MELHVPSSVASTVSATTPGLNRRAPPAYILVLALWIALTVGCGEEPTEPGGTAGVARLHVTPSADTLAALGATVQLQAAAQDVDGNPVTLATFTWVSSDNDVATVSASGVVTAVGNGTCTITVTCGSESAVATIVVRQMVAEVAVTPNPVALAIAETVQLGATVTDANAHPVQGASVSWNSSDNTVATVDTDGLVTAVQPGSAIITASVDVVSESATVTVLSLALTSMRNLLNDHFPQVLMDHLPAATAASLRAALDDVAQAMAEGDSDAIEDALAVARTAVAGGDPSDAPTLAVLTLVLDYAEILLGVHANARNLEELDR
jgi:hypothetical protein